jgi:hypothetical protein
MVWIWTVPQRLTCPQLVTLFWEVLETLSWRKWLSEGLPLKVSCSWPLPVSLFPVSTRWAALLHCTFPAMMLSLASGPQQWNQPNVGWKFWKHAQNQPFHLFNSFSQVFVSEKSLIHISWDISLGFDFHFKELMYTIDKFKATWTLNKQFPSLFLLWPFKHRRNNEKTKLPWDHRQGIKSSVPCLVRDFLKLLTTNTSPFQSLHTSLFYLKSHSP